MSATIERARTPNPLDLCTVVVIYDDPVTRTRALTACDYLVGQLWETVELDFHWWRTDFLNDPMMSRAAAHYATAADFLIVCSRGIDDLSNTLETWAASWIHNRTSREGALIDLSVVSGIPSQSNRLQQVLRGIARLGNFDYLTTVEPRTPEGGRTTGATLSTRPAATDPRLDRLRPSSHFGLNE